MIPVSTRELFMNLAMHAIDSAILNFQERYFSQKQLFFLETILAGKICMYVGFKMY